MLIVARINTTTATAPMINELVWVTVAGSTKPVAVGVTDEVRGDALTDIVGVWVGRLIVGVAVDTAVIA